MTKMSDTNQPQTGNHITRPCCRMCGGERTEKKRRSINGFAVCKKCYNAFVNRRQAAFVIDSMLYFGLAHLLFYLIRTQPLIRAWIPVIYDLILALLIWLPFAFKDGFTGRSLGKWLMDLRVVEMETRQPAGFRRSFLRNFYLCIPVFQLFAFLVDYFDLSGRRWGDRLANTLVVWGRYANKLPFNPFSTACFRCGYDLTGNVSGICPECGAVLDEAIRWRITAANSPRFSQPASSPGGSTASARRGSPS
jgi:uncharacterized RDD family membrane protein YckC